MKKVVKILNVLIILLIVMSLFSNVNAAELKTTLDIIQKESETKYFENDQGYISKTIVDSNADNGEVTIELKLSNTKKAIEEKKETEIFLVVDNSGSMGYATSTGEVRRNMVIRAIKKLINDIYNSSSNVKVGLVRFADEGELLTKSTSLMCSLTNDKQKLMNAITEYENLNTSVIVDGVEMKHCESGTNIEAGLKKANDNFSSECENKILILVTDGIPNASINYTYSTSSIYNATKNRLKNIEKSGTTIISLMTGVTKEDNDATNIDAQAVVKEIFGTEENPTAGKFYNIKDANLEKVVTEDILYDIIEKIQSPINNVKVVDYFPEDIIENFEFSYVGNSSKGTVTEVIDKETKTITWNIDTLKGDEVATLKYKLKMKDMSNTKLLNKIIATNEKVVLTYKDKEQKDYEVILNSSPKIQLSEVKEELTATVSYDPTTNTTGKVKATIKTNKEVEKVEGWELSEDKKTLTKTYSKNTTETVKLVSVDGMKKDVVVKISNIVTENKVDNTIAPGKMPQTGEGIFVFIAISIISIISIFLYKKNVKYRDI